MSVPRLSTLSLHAVDKEFLIHCIIDNFIKEKLNIPELDTDELFDFIDCGDDFTLNLCNIYKYVELINKRTLHNKYTFKGRCVYNEHCLYPIYNNFRYSMLDAFLDISDSFDISLIWKLLLEENTYIANSYEEKVIDLFISAGAKQGSYDIILNNIKDQDKLNKLRYILHCSHSFKNGGAKIFLSDYISEKHPHLIENNETQLDIYTVSRSKQFKNKEHIINNKISKHILANKGSFEQASDATYDMFGYSFLSCYVNLDFCLIDKEDSYMFLGLIFCNVYNYSINIDFLFDMLNDLPDLKCIINKIDSYVDVLEKFLLDISMYRKDFDENFLVKHSKILHVLVSIHNDVFEYNFMEFLLVLDDKFSTNVLKKTQFLIDYEKIELVIISESYIRLENVSKFISFMKKHNKSLYVHLYTYGGLINHHDIFTYDVSSDLFVYNSIEITITEFINELTSPILGDIICRELYGILNKDYDCKFLLNYY